MNKQDEKRRTALHIAAEKIRMKTKEQKSLLSVLLEKQGINHKLHDNRGRTALDVDTCTLSLHNHVYMYV